MKLYRVFCLICFFLIHLYSGANGFLESLGLDKAKDALQQGADAAKGIANQVADKVNPGLQQVVQGAANLTSDIASNVDTDDVIQGIKTGAGVAQEVASKVDPGDVVQGAKNTLKNANTALDIAGSLVDPQMKCIDKVKRSGERDPCKLEEEFLKCYQEHEKTMSEAVMELEVKKLMEEEGYKECVPPTPRPSSLGTTTRSLSMFVVATLAMCAMCMI